MTVPRTVRGVGIVDDDIAADDLHRRLEVEAARRGTTSTALVIEAFEHVVEPRRRTPTRGDDRR